jgi:hypothetical protein
MATTVRVVVDEARLEGAMARVRAATREAADVAARKVTFDVIAEVASTVPVDTGRLRAGWRLDAVEVVEESGTHVQYAATNAVEYAPAVEYGTATRAPGNHLALALETVRRRVVFGSSASSVRGILRAAIGEAAK